MSVIIGGGRGAAKGKIKKVITIAAVEVSTAAAHLDPPKPYHALPMFGLISPRLEIDSNKKTIRDAGKYLSTRTFI